MRSRTASAASPHRPRHGSDADRRRARGTDSTTETTGGLPSDGSDDPPTETTAVSPVDPESASSVPIPLLILAGLALLLIAGGSAGYVIRRVQARRLPPQPS